MTELRSAFLVFLFCVAALAAAATAAAKDAPSHCTVDGGPGSDSTILSVSSRVTTVTVTAASAGGTLYRCADGGTTTTQTSFGASRVMWVIGLTADTDYWVLVDLGDDGRSGWRQIRTKSGTTITISGGSAVTEGTAAAFTLTASEAPSTDLTVYLEVSESDNGDFVASTDEGSKQVTIESGATTATYSVATQGDSVDEPNGSVTVTVSGASRYSVGTTGSASVTVNDDDEPANNAPVFTNQPTALSVAENSAGGGTVGTVAATDQDGDTLSYSLDATSDAVFDISSSGDITVQSGATLDHEAKASYSATVTADDGTATATHTVRISVTDENERPEAPAPPSVGTASTTSVTVSWTAPSVTGKPPITDYDVRYRNSGVITWTDHAYTGTGTSTSITGLSTSTTYEVQVRAKNEEGTSDWSATGSGATNSRTNNAPVFTNQPTTLSVVESSVGGRTVGTLAATDRDGDTLNYSLDVTSDAVFDISSSGEITVQSGATLDYEAKASYSATVTADDGTATVTHSVTIRVTDANERPEAPSAPLVEGTSTTSVTVSWTAPSVTGKPPITDYDVQYRGSGVPTWTDHAYTGTGTSTRITGLSTSTTYEVQVRAKNDEGTSDWSATGSGATNSPAPSHCTVDGGPGSDSTILSVSSRVTTVTVTAASAGGTLYRCADGGTTTTQTSFGASRVMWVIGLTADTDYWVLVDLGDDGRSGWRQIRTKSGTTITISGGSAVTEGTAAAFTLTASEAPSTDLTVYLEVSESDNGDFVASTDEGSKQVTIESGATTATYSVATQGDSVDEPNGSVTVTVSGASRYSVGTTGSASVTVNDDDEPAKNASDTVPGFGVAVVSAVALELGQAVAPMLLPAATGGNGDLTYRLTSVPVGLAGLDFDPATRRLSGTPGTRGSWVFTYRVEDADANRADSDAAVLRFGVTVAEARTVAVRRRVQQTLAAVGRRTLSSALENIGTRLVASLPETSLTLAGARRSFAESGTGGWEGVARSCGAGLRAYSLGATTDGCSLRWMRGVEADEVLRASTFSLTLGAVEGSRSLAHWSMWGRGDMGTFEGRPDPDTRYSGDTRSGWFGVDARIGQWVAGLALSHGRSEADYALEEAGRGRLETTLNAFYPYGRWTFDNGLELRGVLGVGTGEARHYPENGERETGDLSMWMASLGLRRDLLAVGGIDLATRADASLTRMETGKGPRNIGNLSADAWRARLGVEASRRFALGEDKALTPFVEAAGRRDGGDGLTGAGLELAGGLRYGAPGIRVEARGRWLAAHAQEGARERGVGVTARIGPGAHGRGLWFMLAPRWGDAARGGAEALWRDDMPRLSGSGGGDAGALEARMGYGIATASGGVLTPFAEAGLAGRESRRLRVGARFDGLRTELGVEVSGERREDGAGGPEHGVRLELRRRF